MNTGRGIYRPPPGATLQTGHPLANELRAAYLFNEPWGNPRDLITNRVLTAHGTPIKTQRGIAMTKGVSHQGVDWYHLDFPPIKSNNNWGMAAWVYNTTVSDVGYDFALCCGNGQGSDGFSIARHGDGGASNDAYVVLLHGVAWVDSGGKLVAGTWQHLAATRRNGTLYMYINGVRTSATSASNPNAPSSTLVIGADNGSGGNRGFGGMVDLPMVWNRPLTDSDVQWLYREPFAMMTYEPVRYFSVPAGGGSSIAPISDYYRRLCAA